MQQAVGLPRRRWLALPQLPKLMGDWRRGDGWTRARRTATDHHDAHAKRPAVWLGCSSTWDGGADVTDCQPVSQSIYQSVCLSVCLPGRSLKYLGSGYLCRYELLGAADRRAP